MASTPVLPQTPRHYAAQISTGSGTGLVTVAIGSSSGTKITSIIASQSDTTPHNVIVGITNTAVFYPLGAVTVSSQAGQVAAVPAANLLSPTVSVGLPIDNDGQTYILLTSSLDSVQVMSSTAVGAGTTISVNAFGADF